MSQSDCSYLRISHRSDHNPMVSFIIPCYGLGHLLGECLNSILAQSYRDFEILIMDDCSPDDTAHVAASFHDPRIRYVRNPSNLGHLRNYNRGISLCRGKYVWLISADDRLRRAYVLDRYIHTMEMHARVGMACCPGIVLRNGAEAEQYDCGDFGPRDRIFTGRDFIAASLRAGYGLLAPSVLARRECYAISTFPLDMPHQGDWYLWFRWALTNDVAYFAEPMVNYRLHTANIMTGLVGRSPHVVFADEVNVLWRTRRHSREAGKRRVARLCERSVTAKYARSAASLVYPDVSSHRSMTPEECERAIGDNAGDRAEYVDLCAQFRTYLGNQHWRHGKFPAAIDDYRAALRLNWAMPIVWLKWLLLRLRLGGIVLLANRFGADARNILSGQARRRPEWSRETVVPRDNIKSSLC